MAGAYVRNMSNELLQRNVTSSMVNVPPASEAELVELARRCSARMEHLFPDPQARSWFNLFKIVDSNKSGRICFFEFAKMLREMLKIPRHEYSDETLRSMWKALDNDSSGNITAGEFGAFMRKANAHEHMTWRERLNHTRRLEAEECRQQREALTTAHRRRFEDESRHRMQRAQTAKSLQHEGAAAAVSNLINTKRKIGEHVRHTTDALLQRDVRDQMSHVTPAPDELVRELADKCNAQLEHLFPDPQARNWFNLFKIVDSNNTGRICFYEMHKMVRDLLRLSRSEVPDEDIKTIWRSIDDDGDGNITAGEFGGFMRKCSEGAKLSWRERQRLASQRSRQELEDKQQAYMRGVVMPMLARKAKELDAQKQRLLLHINDESSGVSSKFVAKVEPRVCMLENNPSHFLSSELRFAYG